jgi:NAD(P)-dependent dehydrogenase (short-subunit alcohol dehydrogenase family)
MPLETLAGRVAVVTGAASGIGRALAERFAAEGMRVVMADVEVPRLEEAAHAIASGGAEVLVIPTDVSRADAVEALATRTLDAFGGVHLVCNNAGVFVGGSAWETPLEDYAWLIDVNVWGVVHGVRTFVPRMLASGEPGHVVNTASMAGMTTAPYAAAYYLTKHAVVGLSEGLYHELAFGGGAVGVSVLCPEAIDTDIGASERVRPERLARRGARSESAAFTEQALREATGRGLAPAVMAERVVHAVRENRFYILAENAWADACQARLDDVRLRRNPTFAVPVEQGE